MTNETNLDTTTQGCGCGSKPKAPAPTVLGRIMEKVFVSEAEKSRRLSICKECPHFGELLTQCGICGCFLEAKTRLVGFHCALDQIGEEPKW
jgi:hypothetical protein